MLRVACPPLPLETDDVGEGHWTRQERGLPVFGSANDDFVPGISPASSVGCSRYPTPAGMTPKTPAGYPPTPLDAKPSAPLAWRTPPRTPPRTPTRTPPRTPPPTSSPRALTRSITPPILRKPVTVGEQTLVGQAASSVQLQGADESIREFAATLGVDVVSNVDLLWVVREASAAELPKGWTEHTDDDGRVYFFEDTSQSSVWEHPLDSVYRDLLAIVMRGQADFPPTVAGARMHRTQAINDHLAKMHQLAVAELEPWHGPYIGEEGEYYFNEKTNISSWDSPLLHWEIELSLRVRVLNDCLLDGVCWVSARRWRLRSVVLAVRFGQQFLRTSRMRRSYVRDAQVDPNVIQQIDLDIPRTAGGDVELNGSLGVTRALLLRHVAEDQELGYCQGMNMAAALFAVATQNQNDAYTRFQAFMTRCRGLWLEGFPLLQIGMAHFEVLAESRPWYQYLCRNSICPDMYLPRAWMAVFAKWLPLATRVLFLEKLEKIGLAGLMALSLALLDLHLPWLLQQGDMDDVLAALEGLRGRAPDAAVLLTAMDAWLPSAEAAVAKPVRKSHKRRVARLWRQGHRVVDGSGRETLYAGMNKRLSSMWTERWAVGKGFTWSAT